MPKVQPGSDVAVLAESTDGPVIAEINRRGVDLLWVAFDPLNSTWWHQRGFANFIPNALDHLATSGGLRTDKGLLPGEVISLLVPAGSTNPKIMLPDETEVVPMLDQDGLLSWGPVSRAGLHTVSWLEPGGREGRTAVAVNLLNARESTIGAREVIDFSVNEVQGVRSSGRRFVSLWPWLLGMAMRTATVRVLAMALTVAQTNQKHWAEKVHLHDIAPTKPCTRHPSDMKNNDFYLISPSL